MALERTIVSEHETPTEMNWNIAEQWAAIPAPNKQDINNPEWPSAPVIRVNVQGFEEIYVMNEGDRRVNEQGTAKNRAFWEIAGVARDHGRMLLANKGSINGAIHHMPVPRFTILTSLNAGHAAAATFEKYGLPPPKLLIDQSRVEQAQKLAAIADIYTVDLGARELNGQDIKQLTNNQDGIDLTSVMMIEPQSTLYDWASHYALNVGAKNIFVPEGSGRYRENLQTWQHRNTRLLARGEQADRRLYNTNITTLTQMSIVGIKPASKATAADKLTSTYNPFQAYNHYDHEAARTLRFTGPLTGSYAVPEEFLEEGYKLLQDIMPVEFSGAAGLGGLLYFADRGLVSRSEKHLVINTGKGDFSG